MSKKLISVIRKKGLFSYMGKFLFQNTTTKQTIVKNTFWLVLAEGISKGLIFFLTILIARYLGAESFGIFSFAFAFVALFAVMADFGLSTLTIREVARDKSLARKYMDNIAVMKLILGIITFVLIYIVTQFLGKTPEVKTLVYLAGIFIIIQSFTQFLISIFRAFEKMQYEVLSKTIYSISLFCIAFFVIWQNLDIKLLVQSYIYAALIAFVITIVLVRKKFTKFWAEIDFKFWKSLLKEAWPFALGIVFTIIYVRIDIIMLSLMKTDYQVGLYNAAYTLLFGFQAINIIHLTTFPRLSKFFNKKEFDKYKKITKEITKKSFYFLIPIALLISVFSKQILGLLFGKEFILAWPALTILIWTGVIIFYNVMWGNSLQITNRQRIWTYCVGIGAVINIILNFLLIYPYGFVGAAIATIITEIVVGLLIYKNNIKEIKFSLFK